MTTNNELLNKLEGEVLEMGRRGRDRDQDRSRDFDKLGKFSSQEDDIETSGESDDLYGTTDITDNVN